MKRNVLLLLDADGDTVRLVCSAAALNNLDLRVTRTSRNLFRLMEDGLIDVAIIVLDVDPGVHAMAVLEALDACGLGVPIIVVSSLEEAHLRPVAIAHGAKDCLGKPISIECLKRAIAKFAHTPETQACRCDLWGHPGEGCTRHRTAPNERELALFSEKN